MTISLTQEAHKRLSDIIREGSIAIDATCGNGYDTVFLAKSVGVSGKVFAFDIQPLAIENTQKKLKQAALENVEFINGCHSKILTLIKNIQTLSIHAIVFNLGYLPGTDKTIITQTETTIKALEAAIELIASGGIISMIVYPGHVGGARETQAVLNWLKRLPVEKFRLEYIKTDTSNQTPQLICIYRL